MPKARAQENIDAIKALKRVQSEGRAATPEEQKVLARYNGFGSSDLLTLVEDYNQHAHREIWQRMGRSELATFLTDEERRSAMASGNNAHYTRPDLIGRIWDGLILAGFKGGNVIDPSMGSGNFEGMMPPEIARASKVHGIEKDILTGQIAQLLYPGMNIRIGGFEDAPFPPGLDLAISNVPFGDFSVFDPEYERHNLLIHDHAIVKSLAALKPGGIGVFITSSGTLDKLNSTARRLMHSHAILAGAVRLPDDSQSAQADTQVTTDLLFFVRRSQPPAMGDTPSWLESGVFDRENNYYELTHNITPLRLNNYFAEHPEAVIGTLKAAKGFQGRRRLAADNSPIQPSQAFASLFAQPGTPEYGTNSILAEESLRIARNIERLVAENRLSTDDAPPEVKARQMALEKNSRQSVVCIGSLVEGVDGGVHKVVESGYGEWVTEPQDYPQAAVARILAYIKVRDAMGGAFEAQLDTGADNYDDRCDEARTTLNAAYDRFVAEYGPLNLQATRRLVAGDPAFGRTMALERFDDEKQTAAKADLFSRNVIRVSFMPEPGSAKTPQDALSMCLNLYGKPYPNEIGTLCGMDAKEALQVLLDARRVFIDPEDGQCVLAETYLSGNVRDKLRKAAAAASADRSFKANADSLKSVLPQDIPREEIFARMGASWIPEDVVEEFVVELIDLRTSAVDNVSAVYDEEMDGWFVRIPFYGISTAAKLKYGTEKKSVIDLLDAGFNQRQVKVTETVADEETGKKKSVVNSDETEAANEKLDAIKARFKEFLWEDPERSKRLERIYNDRFNCHVPLRCDGSHLTFPGMNPAVSFRKHQKDAVWRGVISDNTLLNHEVGTGKTMIKAAIAMEMRRLGLAEKPMIGVKNHMIEQVEREARQLYPNGKILVVGKEDMDREGRAAMMGRIANNDWDMVIITHWQLNSIQLNPDFMEGMIRSQLDEMNAYLNNMVNENGRKTHATKAIEAACKRLENKLKKLAAGAAERQGEALWFDELGVDALLLDESHNYKNLSVAVSDQSEVAGSSIGGSDRAFDLYCKLQWLYEKLGKESNVVFATGTPVSNNLLEIYNIQRYLQGRQLKEMGISGPNAWAGNFLEPKTSYEPEVSGIGFRRRTRFALVNIPELTSVLCNVMDTVRADDVSELLRPELESTVVRADASPVQQCMMEDLSDRLLEIRGGNVDPKVDNLLKIVGEGRKLALDPRLLDPFAEYFLFGKVNEMIGNALTLWKETTADKGVQLIFCDIGIHGKPFNTYDDIKDKLVANGVQPKEIAFIQDAKNDKAKAEMLAKARSGQIRFLLGSTAIMGEGTNVQTRLVAMHQLDAPWRPSDILQRRGRGWRHGNLNANIKEFIYVTEGTFDQFMWTVLKTKADQFVQILSGQSGQRTYDLEVDPTFGEALALASNNPLMKIRLEAEQEVSRLSGLLRVQNKQSVLFRQMRERNEESLNAAKAGLARDTAFLALRSPLPASSVAAAPSALAADAETPAIGDGGVVDKPLPSAHPDLFDDKGGGDENAIPAIADATAAGSSPKSKPAASAAQLDPGGWQIDPNKWLASGGALPSTPRGMEVFNQAALHGGTAMHQLRPLISQLVKGRSVEEHPRGLDVSPGLSYRSIPVSLSLDSPKTMEDRQGKKTFKIGQWLLGDIDGPPHGVWESDTHGNIEIKVGNLEESIEKHQQNIPWYTDKIKECKELERKVVETQYESQLIEAKARLNAVMEVIEGKSISDEIGHHAAIHN